jgi:hypothetical protein
MYIYLPFVRVKEKWKEMCVLEAGVIIKSEDSDVERDLKDHLFVVSAAVR